MKKTILSVVAGLFLVGLLAAPSMAWQGRMAGAGDANGLIEDESDYLIHPAAIASGRGFNAYGHYRLTYDKATQWDYSASAPTAGVTYPYTTSGHSWKNEGQLGTAFNLGAGRMGVFFDFTDVRGTYSGEEKYAGVLGPNYHAYDLNDKLDNFALKVIYGLPVQAVKLGGELQIAYRNEEQETFFSDMLMKNYPWAAENAPALDLYPYMIPFKSKYWEAQGKASIAGMLGPAKYAFTLKGAIPFASSNEYNYENDKGPYVNAEGKVKGFNVAGDFWLRVPLSDRMVLPFVVSAGYKDIKRDGSAPTADSSLVTYEHEAKDIFVKVGGGMDYTPAKGTRIAAGLYYDYLRTDQSIYFTDVLTPADFYVDDYADMPKYTEHRLTVKALAEKELCARVVLRGGFNLFYGMVKSDYAYSASDDVGPYMPLVMSTSGSNLGVNVSAGATVNLDRVSLEPFINAGYVKYKTSGDGTIGSYPAEAEFNKANWLVGGGLSVKF
jgi:hypothetical protein